MTREGRTCTVCGKFKPPEEFGKDRRARDGLKAKCRICEREYMRRYYQKHREDLLARNRQYHKDNREQISERKRKYYRDHPDKAKGRYERVRSAPNYKEKHAARQRAWRKKNPERAREISRRAYWRNREKIIEGSRRRYRENADEYKARAAQYRKENMDRVLKWNRERKMRKLEIPGTHTVEQWLELCEMFDGVCPCCGQKANLTVDHIIPISWEGSSDWITNIQPLCGSCNCSKSNKRDTDYRPEHVKVWAEREMEKCQ